MIRHITKVLLAALLLASGAAHAQLLSKFGPVNGILVGQVANPQTAAATSANVISLWSGTCDASHFLAGNGACASAISGTVTVPQGGTGQVTLPVHGLLVGEGTSNVASVAAMGLDTFLGGVGTGADPVAIAFPNCASPSALTYSTSLHQMLCSTITSFGTPTALVGLTAVTGSSNVSMASDSAPALNQAIAPTMTGLWKWQISAADTYKECPTSNWIFGPVACGSEPSTTFPGNILASGSFAGGFQPFFGRNTSNDPAAKTFVEAANDVITHEMVLATTSSTNTTPVGTGAPATETGYVGSPATKNLCWLMGGVARWCTPTTGGFTTYGATAAAQVDATADSGSFTITYTGFTTTVSGTAKWSRMGNIAVLVMPALTGTSNATTFTATGLPAAITPITTQGLASSLAAWEDNTVVAAGGSAEVVASSTVVTFFKGGSSSGWTAAGTKGFALPQTLTYILN